MSDYKVVFPLEGLNSSGGLRIVTDLANFASSNGYSIDVIVPSYSSCPYYSFDPAVNVVIINISSTYFAKLQYIVKLINYLRKYSNVCFYATGYKTPIFIRCAMFLMPKSSFAKSIYLIQHYEITSQILNRNSSSLISKAILYSIAYVGYKLSQRKVAVSHWIKKKLKDDSVLVIPNGIDLSKFKPLPVNSNLYNKLNVGIAGSNKPIKGYNLILQAFSKLDKDILDMLNISLLTQESLELPSGIECSVINSKNDYDVSKFYSDCDFFIFASYEEGFGLPPLEAMACGTPVICSQCGGVDEFITSDNALLFKPGDLQGLVHCIIKMASSSSLRQRLSEKGLNTASCFSIDDTMKRHLDVLNSI